MSIEALLGKLQSKIFYPAFFSFLFLLTLQTLGEQDSRSYIDHYASARFRHLTINEGLSQNLISDITQDQKGFVWIGTKDGLNMYDGYKFTIFKHDPFDPNSISENHIISIFCDSQGRLWIGTFSKGLNLYHRSTGKFIRFTHDPENNNSISSDYILSITDDSQGNIWVGTSQGGLNKISFKTNDIFSSPEEIIITRFGQNSANEGLSDQAGVTSLLVDNDEMLWVGSANSIFKLNTQTSNPVPKEIPVRLINSSRNKFHRELHNKEGRIIIFQDAKKKIWMLSRLGLFQYDESTEAFRQVLSDYSINIEEGITYNPLAAEYFQNKDRQEFWLSTEKALFIYYPETGLHENLSAEGHEESRLPKGQIISILEDKAGTLWLGSNGYGIALYDPFKLKFSYPDNTGNTKDGIILSSRDLSIRSFYETNDGILWIGANEGFYRVNRAESELREVLLKSEYNPQMVVYSIDQGKEDVLWLASSAGLIRFNPINESYIVYPAWHRENPFVSEPNVENDDPRVAKVLVRAEQIWVLTPYSLALFNKQTGEFDHLRYNNDPLSAYREHSFPNLLQQENDCFWVGTHHGFHLIEFESKKITTYINDPSNPESLPFNNVRAILRDPFLPDSILWLATGGGGIARFDKNRKVFTNFSEEQGLANNMVYGMLADEGGNFWLSTNKGLSKFNVAEQTFFNYTVSDGLQSNEFNSGAFYKNQSGEFFFGGINGYNSFFPESIRKKSFMASIMITGFKLLNAGDETNRERYHSIFDESPELVLKHYENHFSIEFASLDFAESQKNIYSYSITTLSENWIPIGHYRTVTFTDMKPGTYYFRVRGTNNDGIWSKHEAALKITILPPWWKRQWVLVIYFLLAVGALAGLREYEKTRFRLRNRMRLIEMEKEKLKEIDHMKSEFFANISHEFRTPLTLIMGPVEQMLEEDQDPKKQKTFSVMHANAGRLLNLVNQLLDLSKLESGNYEVKASRGDLIGFLKGLLISFASKAEQKNIKLHFDFDPKIDRQSFREKFYFDRDILEKIINNLISNAFKFTPDGGEVNLRACIKTLRGKDHMIEILLKDTGIGIHEEKLPFIFDRFYQADASPQRVYEGSGIGLAFVKELVRVHHGQIIAKSKPAQGTTFVLRFPIGKEHFLENQILNETSQPLKSENKSTTHQQQQVIPEEPELSAVNGTDQTLILVVDDHAEVRDYISQNLKTNYLVEEASNALEGQKLAMDMIPDLIICDIMMPGMDGFEFCKELKNDIKTSHIPIILLTALSGQDEKIQGLETGADDYLTKPFNPRELLARVNNLIENRQMLRLKFSSNAIIKPREISVTPRDQVFMENLIKVVEDNIANIKYSIEDLSRDVGMSQSQLHRKLKALVNQTTNHFVRSIKMHRAKELLEKDAGTIAEIAYMVGYDDPGYFSKSYKAFFGNLPSEVRKKPD
ncbi:MAG: two-component regulator propeller domain-containing protein [Bacteroides sp.]|jgi:signal transduction histidine kinase/ligand-binding sensor domain-containing protein/DNA-binding response OmpR family regulator|nr:two-component regulator propeller domain-containing protein [Bacteroides sp.]